MTDFSKDIHIGELIAVSKVFQINTYRMLTLLENGSIEVFKNKEAFMKKYGDKESYGDLEWCELNNGKIFTMLK
ncbi:hypothetical protein [Neobacillus thermocopriae]|uniref:Uncharacterized protein n=1 Tax=Neobacillus thermocopriae TaxID=1215031 RepID=A0A6B3TUF0_9BACI|nr:hypothetical protein [Neobacillus thermocopriae]MED3623200.1 hypothetical protein [Neobacillus thermocopriae]MED3715278.1 hypothetical protein [Neobacillus thermocopriae]NEX79631.1 hypothetical protein [Neobacillus thermocopriae]